MKVQLFAWLAVIAVAIHAAATALLHWLVPGVNPVSEMVSAYLNSDYQWLSRLTFAALGCTFGALSLALALRQTQGILFTVAIVLAAVATIGYLGVAAVPTAVSVFARPTQPATLGAILLLSFVLRREAEWQSVGLFLTSIGFGLIALFLATIIFGALVTAGLGGLANRAVLVLIYTWALLVARGLLKTSYTNVTGAT